MNETDPSRDDATCLRTLCLRIGAILTASFALTVAACATLPALAGAHAHRATAVGHASRGHRGRRPAAHRAARQGRRLRAASAVPPVPARDTGLALRSWAVRAPRRCAGAHVLIGRASWRDTERATLCLLNRQRMRRDLPPLRVSNRLERSAQGWTDTMVRDHAFTHGSDFGSRISAVGFDWSQIGENIADGYRTPMGAVQAWMASTGHCENILNPDFREVGAGFARGSAVQHGRRGTWTLDLGLLMHQHAPSDDWTPAEHCPY